MARIGKFIIFGLVFFLCAASRAEVKVSADPDRKELSIGDTLNVSVSVSTEESAAIGEPRLPELQNFDLVGKTSAFRAQSTMTNGTFKFVRTTVYNFALNPRSNGDFLFKPIDVVVGGKTYSTKPFTVKVTDDPANPRPRPNPQAGPPMGDEEENDPLAQMEDDFNALLQRRNLIPKNVAPPDNFNPDEAFFVRVEVDKDHVYEGEQITATWYLYTRVDLRDFDTLKYPNVTGFWKEDIEVATALNFKTEVINGLAYRKAVIISYALFPIKPGPIEIDPIKIKAIAMIPQQMGVFTQPYSFTKASKPVKVTVLPLPADRPASFSGAVGNFEAKVTTDKNQVPANEPFPIHIRIEGHGNAKVIELPTVKYPESFELYQTKNDSKFFPDGRSYKDFEVMLVPRVKGEFSIPSFEFSYFDTQQKKYVTKKTEPVPVKVVEGTNASAPQTQSQRLQVEEKKAAPEIKTLPGPVLRDENLWSRLARQKYPLWAAIYLLCFGFMGLQTVRLLKAGDGQAILSQVFDTRLKAINKESNFRKIGGLVVNAVYHVIAQMSESDSGSDSIDHLISGLPPSVKKEVGELPNRLKFFEALGFAPESALGEMKTTKRIDQEIKDMKKLITRAISVYEENPK